MYELAEFASDCSLWYRLWPPWS